MRLVCLPCRLWLLRKCLKIVVTVVVGAPNLVTAAAVADSASDVATVFAAAAVATVVRVAVVTVALTSKAEVAMTACG
jgi:hypothetical protein